MLQPAIAILDSQRTMAVSTVRPDGWPQTTIVGYANDGWTVYFLVFRASQKFANIAHDNRISIAVGRDPRYLSDVKAVYAGAHAFEVTEESEQALAWKLLMERHPNLADFGTPDQTETAFMRAECKHVSVLDYSKGIGHVEALTVGEDGSAQNPAPALSP